MLAGIVRLLEGEKDLMTTVSTPLLRIAIGASAAALLLASCTGEDAPTPTTAPTDENAATSSADVGQETADAALATLAPVACDAEREPSELEASLLVEPGSMGGEGADPAAILAAAQETDPGSPQEWAAQIRYLAQGDYADSVCEVMSFSAAIGDGSAGPTETPPDEAPGANHFALVLDASGSMEADAGGVTRMEAAKEAIEGFVDTIPDSSTVSLRIYGHEGDNTDGGKAESCDSSEVVYDGAADADALQEQLAEVDPVGWTPLARAIEDAEGDIPEDATDAIVYVVTDGKETCGGDPVAAAEGLADAGVEPVVNVIGFQAGDADQEALRAIAEAGGGDYTRADSPEALESYWADEYLRMAQAWNTWRQEEMARINDEGSANAARAGELGRVLDVEAEVEYTTMAAVIDLMRAEGTVENADLIETWDLLREQNAAIDDYAAQTRDANFDLAMGEWNARWQEAYDAGSAKWTEYYAKSRGEG